jgi:hypothetical protein
MKQYGPRMFHFIGSTGYSPTTGTEVLGTAAGGVKITLYNVNEVKPWSESVAYTADDIEVLNERIFHTMHHEFSHILHQTKSYPITFGQVTSGSYDPIDWHERDSVSSHQMGYVTHYASSATYEDFVETLSCIITDNDYRWMMRIISASAAGLRPGDKEGILQLISDLGIDKNKANTHWNNFKLYSESEYNSETGTYDPTDRVVIDVHRSSEQVINKDYTAYVSKYKYTELKSFTSFDDFLNWIPQATGDKVAGINAMLKKISIATKWHQERWGLNTFTLREEVRQRQNNMDEFLKNDLKIFELK